MHVFVTNPTNAAYEAWEKYYVPRFLEELRASPGDYAIAPRAEDADMIVLLESNLHKPRDQNERLLAEPLLKLKCAQVCAINYEDSPAGYLRGLYSSLEDYKFDPAIHRSWPALNLPNEAVYTVDDETIRAHVPRRLFSFAGSLSHPLRRRLLERFSSPAAHYQLTEVKRWFDHSESEAKNYVEEILSSRFVLCPRGHASYTHRIVEVMALGRVPVVLADQWVPFSISETDYYLRVPEARFGELENILAGRQAEAAAMGARARQVWLKYFSRRNRARGALDAIRALMATPEAAVSAESYHRRWNSVRFRKVNKLMFRQRAWRMAERFLRRWK